MTLHAAQRLFANIEDLVLINEELLVELERNAGPPIHFSRIFPPHFEPF